MNMRVYNKLWDDLEKAKMEVTVLIEDEEGSKHIPVEVITWDDLLDIMRILEDE